MFRTKTEKYGGTVSLAPSRGNKSVYQHRYIVYDFSALKCPWYFIGVFTYIIPDVSEKSISSFKVTLYFIWSPVAITCGRESEIEGGNWQTWLNITEYASINNIINKSLLAMVAV